MALDMEIPNGGEFGDFTDREVRTMVYELASEMYRPAHEALLATFAEELTSWTRDPARSRHGAPRNSPQPAPRFDDSLLAPVWVACMNRAKTHVIDMLRMKTDFDVPALGLRGESTSPIASAHDNKAA